MNIFLSVWLYWMPSARVLMCQRNSGLHRHTQHMHTRHAFKACGGARPTPARIPISNCPGYPWRMRMHSGQTYISTHRAVRARGRPTWALFSSLAMPEASCRCPLTSASCATAAQQQRAWQRAATIICGCIWLSKPFVLVALASCREPRAGLVLLESGASVLRMLHWLHVHPAQRQINAAWTALRVLAMCQCKHQAPAAVHTGWEHRARCG